MRGIFAVSIVSFMVALMVAQPVSAETLVAEVDDGEGDVPHFWDSLTGEAFTQPTNGNQMWCSYGCFDMTSYCLSKDLETNMFTFRMDVVEDFLEPADALTGGVQRVDWLIWFDRVPWNYVLAPESTTEYQLNLTCDGTRYSCSFCDYVMLAGDVIETLVFNLDGTVFSTSFSGNLVGDISDDEGVEFYWMVVIRVIFGGNSCMFADVTDWYSASNQVMDSIPWPLCCE